MNTFVSFIFIACAHRRAYDFPCDSTARAGSHIAHGRTIEDIDTLIFYLILTLCIRLGYRSKAVCAVLCRNNVAKLTTADSNLNRIRCTIGNHNCSTLSDDCTARDLNLNRLVLTACCDSCIAQTACTVTPSTGRTLILRSDCTASYGKFTAVHCDTTCSSIYDTTAYGYGRFFSRIVDSEVSRRDQLTARYNDRRTSVVSAIRDSIPTSLDLTTRNSYLTSRSHNNCELTKISRIGFNNRIDVTGLHQEFTSNTNQTIASNCTGICLLGVDLTFCICRIINKCQLLASRNNDIVINLLTSLDIKAVEIQRDILSNCETCSHQVNIVKQLNYIISLSCSNSSSQGFIICTANNHSLIVISLGNSKRIIHITIFCVRARYLKS